MQRGPKHEGGRFFQASPGEDSAGSCQPPTLPAPGGLKACALKEELGSLLRVSPNSNAETPVLTTTAPGGGLDEVVMAEPPRGLVPCKERRTLTPVVHT